MSISLPSVTEMGMKCTDRKFKQGFHTYHVPYITRIKETLDFLSSENCCCLHPFPKRYYKLTCERPLRAVRNGRDESVGNVMLSTFISGFTSVQQFKSCSRVRTQMCCEWLLELLSISWSCEAAHMPRRLPIFIIKTHTCKKHVKENKTSPPDQKGVSANLCCSSHVSYNVDGDITWNVRIPFRNVASDRLRHFTALIRAENVQLIGICRPGWISRKSMQNGRINIRKYINFKRADWLVHNATS